MKLKILFTLFLIPAFILAGCASTRLTHGYKVEGQQIAEFENLSDELALKMVILIYNTTTDGFSEETAKSITLDKYIILLDKRKSKYLEDSGVFDLTYEKIDIKKWSDQDLIKVFEELRAETMLKYQHRTISHLTEEENAHRIIHLTGLKEIARELKARENTRYAWDIAGQVLATALSVAVSII